MYCKSCGRQIDDDAAFCSHCGTNLRNSQPQKRSEGAPTSGVRCAHCGSSNVDIQVHQENLGGHTITKSKSKYREKGHGCLWWLIFGWWWWAVDIFLWIFFFPFRLAAGLMKKKKYTGKSTSVTRTDNTVEYRTVCLCKNCGYRWEK